MILGGGGAVSHISVLHYELLAAEDTNEGRLGMRFDTWCIVKLH